MKCKFRIGDKVELKQQTVVHSTYTYAGYRIVPGGVYTIIYIDPIHPTDIKLNNHYWVDARDIEISYSEMLKKVLE